ncbi:MAG: hypothetical protein AB7Q42_00010 [Acidimicrobiia bacterium]
MGGLDLGVTVDVLAACDAAIADRVGVERVLVAISQLRCWLDGIEVADVARLEQLAVSCPAMFPEQVTASVTRRSLRDATRVQERAATVTAVPAFAEGLTAGTVSGAHVDVLAAALRELSAGQRERLVARSPRLVAVAGEATVEEFRRTLTREVRSITADDGASRLERQRREVRLRTWTDADTGMVRLDGRFDPATGLSLLHRLADCTGTLFHGPPLPGCPEDPLAKQDFLRAHALLELISGTGSGVGRAGPDKLRCTPSVGVSACSSSSVAPPAVRRVRPRANAAGLPSVHRPDRP